MECEPRILRFKCHKGIASAGSCFRDKLAQNVHLYYLNSASTFNLAGRKSSKGPPHNVAARFHPKTGRSPDLDQKHISDIALDAGRSVVDVTAEYRADFGAVRGKRSMRPQCAMEENVAAFAFLGGGCRSVLAYCLWHDLGNGPFFLVWKTECGPT